MLLNLLRNMYSFRIRKYQLAVLIWIRTLTSIVLEIGKLTTLPRDSKWLVWIRSVVPTRDQGSIPREKGWYFLHCKQ